MTVQPAQLDAFRRPAVDQIRLSGLFGKRFDLNRLNRLHNQEEDHLLWPFLKKYPEGKSTHPDYPTIRSDWQGEYLGTWLDAALIAAWNAGDDRLKAKIDAMVEALLSTRQPDGYIGDHVEADRWKSWDVWSVAHTMIGLMSYYRHTGDKRALEGAIGCADRVLRDFGPGKRQLSSTGLHHGMTSSAIIEPLVWLYLETGGKEYLDFCEHVINTDWEATPESPRIVSALMAGKGVAQTANGKAIEMLICFAGLLEVYRAAGDPKYLDPILRAWDDIRKHQLYITGSASTGEGFQKDFLLRNDGNLAIGETCMSMGWLYLSVNLGRLLGDGKFFDAAEITLYNHLLGAQSPDGKGWQYYLGLRDQKRYRWHVDPECCPTRGVRALAHVLQHAIMTDGRGVVVNFYDAGEAALRLDDGTQVGVALASEYPFDGAVKITIAPQAPARFSVRLRAPAWCERIAVKINGKATRRPARQRGYLVLDRTWSPGDTVALVMDMPVRAVVDTVGNNGRVALMRGPVVYAADSGYLERPTILDDIVLMLDKSRPARGIRVVRNAQTGTAHLIASRLVAKPKAPKSARAGGTRYADLAKSDVRRQAAKVELVPFFEAGNKEPDAYKDGWAWTNHEPMRVATFQVWLPYVWSKVK